MKSNIVFQAMMSLCTLCGPPSNTKTPAVLRERFACQTCPGAFQLSPFRGRRTNWTIRLSCSAGQAGQVRFRIRSPQGPFVRAMALPFVSRVRAPSLTPRTQLMPYSVHCSEEASRFCVRGLLRRTFLFRNNAFVQIRRARKKKKSSFIIFSRRTSTFCRRCWKLVVVPFAVTGGWSVISGDEGRP